MRFGEVVINQVTKSVLNGELITVAEEAAAASGKPENKEKARWIRSNAYLTAHPCSDNGQCSEESHPVKI